MNSKELKTILRKTFPSLKKPFFGEDPIICRDGIFPSIPNAAEIYRHIDQLVWEHIHSIGLEYGENFPDCDDFSDIKLGRFKEEWWKAMQAGRIPYGTPPKYAVADGYNPTGNLHDFNIRAGGNQIWISDYGNIVGPEGYKPLKVRF